jgi:histone-lysine N-methyltransferase SETD3
LYGFAVERNPFNSVDVTVSIAPRTESFVKEIADEDVAVDPLAEEKIEFLSAAGREKTVDFPCYADRYPIEMLEYLRLMQMTPEDSRYVADFVLYLVHGYGCMQP